MDNRYIYDMNDEDLLEACEITMEELEELEKVEELESDTDNSGTYNISARNMLFGGFRSGVREDVIQNSNRICHICHKRVADRDISIDHVKPVSTWFNQKGYRKNREERMAWYNNIKNLVVTHSKCNSSKGGERFDLNKIKQVAERGEI